MLRYLAEVGTGKNLVTKIFKNLDEMNASGIGFDYVHEIKILKTTMLEKRKKEITNGRRKISRRLH